ncbi:hypothetical protein EDB86DRAFT_219539 [Lactarius hatsudake]|nr:hypothetical protein EDB86DRAFT_219539 [Lactarius hatsudake]
MTPNGSRSSVNNTHGRAAEACRNDEIRCFLALPDHVRVCEQRCCHLSPVLGAVHRFNPGHLSGESPPNLGHLYPRMTNKVSIIAFGSVGSLISRPAYTGRGGLIYGRWSPIEGWRPTSDSRSRRAQDPPQSATKCESRIVALGSSAKVGPKEWKVQITLTDEEPRELARTDTRGVLQRVQYKMKGFGRLVPWQNADVACSRVQSGIVNLARNARRLASTEAGP